MQSFFYLFYPFVNYDTDHFEILSTSIQSSCRFLHKKKQVSALENSIIPLLKELFKINSDKKIREELKKFKNILISIDRSYLDKYIFKYFDLASRLESKVEKRAFVEIEKRNF